MNIKNITEKTHRQAERRMKLLEEQGKKDSVEYKHLIGKYGRIVGWCNKVRIHKPGHPTQIRKIKKAKRIAKTHIGQPKRTSKGFWSRPPEVTDGQV